MVERVEFALQLLLVDLIFSLNFKGQGVVRLSVFVLRLGEMVLLRLMRTAFSFVFVFCVLHAGGALAQSSSYSVRTTGNTTRYNYRGSSGYRSNSTYTKSGSSTIYRSSDSFGNRYMETCVNDRCRSRSY